MTSISELIPHRTPSRIEKVREVVRDCFQRRSAGEVLTDESVVAEHRDLLPELAAELEKLRQLEAAWRIADSDHAEEQLDNISTDAAQDLCVRCPHCHTPTPVVVDSSLADIACSACGAHFSLVGADDDDAPLDGVRRIGRFELIEQLGVGGFGAVWKAFDPELDRLVALKVPRRGQLTAAETEQFFREARAAAQLRHPNIVSVFEVGRDGDRVYIVSDLVEGPSLAEWSAEQRMSVREAAGFCQKVAEALAHAHAEGVIHRDLKPANILVDAHGEPHLTDFGLASRKAQETTVTADGQLLGTPAYMSPEQARGEAHSADHASDIFSLGVILYELLMGELPFRGNVHALLEQIVSHEPSRPRSLNRLIPRDLETICLKCLEKEPHKRFSSARELAADFERYLSGKPIQARPISRTARTWRWCQRNPRVAGLTAAVVSLLLAISIAAPILAWRESVRRRAAVAQEQNTYRRLYFSDMHGAVEVLAGGNVGQVMNLLNRHRPQAGREDLRGFEWYYLWRQCQRGLSQRTVRHGSNVHCVAISPDGTTLATGGVDNVIKLWDLRSGEWLRTLPVNTWVESVAFAPGGKTLACRNIFSVQVWNVADGELKLDALDESFSNNALALSPDGSVLAASIHQRSVIQLWDTSTNRPLPPIEVPQGECFTLAFSPDGSLLASADADGTVTLLDPATGKQRLALPGRCDYPTPLCFTRDGDMLVTGGVAGAVVVWDLESRTPRHTLSGHAERLSSLALSRDGTLLASASVDGTVKLWDTERFEEQDTLLGSSGMVLSVAFSPDRRTLAVGGTDGVVRFWDLTTAAPRELLKGHAAGVWCVAVSPDGKRIASGADDGTVKLWDTDSGQELDTIIDAHVGNVWCAAFDPNGKVLATGGKDAKIRLWDADSGKPKGVLEGHTGWVRNVAFTPDGRRLMSSSHDGTVRVWDLDLQRPPRSYSTNGTVQAAAVSPCGRFIAAGEDNSGTIAILDLRTLTLRRTLIGHHDDLESIAFSPVGGTLASAGHDRTVKLWNWESGREVHTLVGHTDAVYSVAFSPDGRTLASASHDESVRLWDVATGDERAVLRGHSWWVTWLAFAPDGRTIVSASGDKTVRLWRAASEEEVRAAQGAEADHRDPDRLEGLDSP